MPTTGLDMVAEMLTHMESDKNVYLLQRLL